MNRVLANSESNIYSQMTREFDTNGILLSGGELQKLGLARIINENVGLLILDEPSSALDPLAEYELVKLLNEKSRTTSAIIIAHRLSTIRDANRIYVMDDGHIVESGTHSTLMKKRGLYYTMFKKQSENYIIG